MTVLQVLLQFLLGIAVVAAGFVLFMGAALIISGLFVDNDRLYDKDSRFYRFLLYYYTILIYIAARIKVEVSGKELIPREGQFLLVTNHRSNFDPITSWITLRRRVNLAFISKPENFRIPFFGRIIRRCCFMPIDRENPRNAKTTVDRAAALMKNGVCSVGIYPEGTRSRTGKLLPFHNMVFRIAKEAGVPILVAVMENTEQVRKNFPFKKTCIKLKYLDLITVEEVMSQRTNQLGSRVRNAMLKALNQTDEDNGNNKTVA